MKRRIARKQMKKRLNFISSLSVKVKSIDDLSLIPDLSEYVITGKKCFLEKFYEKTKP